MLNTLVANVPSDADLDIFQRRGGIEEENFEIYMFVDTRINACTQKTSQTCNPFSLLPFQEDCLLFFALFYHSFLFLKFQRKGCNPRNPHLDPPMCSIMTIRSLLKSAKFISYYFQQLVTRILNMCAIDMYICT